MIFQHCDDCCFKTMDRKKAINVSNKFVKYGDKTIHLNDIIVYTKDSKDNKDYRRVRDIYTNCGNVYISAGLNSFPEMLFDYIEIVNLEDLSLTDILAMYTYEIHYDFDSVEELTNIYENIINKKYDKDEPVDHSDSEDTYAGLTKDELGALGWFLVYKSMHM